MLNRKMEIEYIDVPIERLEVHPKVQRDLRIKHVRNIARNWNMIAFNAPTVIEMTSGKRGWYIIDGQHTVAAAKIVGLRMVPVKKVRAHSRAEMNSIFQLINSGRMPVSNMDSYALNAANDTTTDDHQSFRALKDAGFTMQSGGTGVWNINAAGEIRRSYKTLGRDHFHIAAQLFALIAENGSRVDTGTIRAITELVRRYASDEDAIADIGHALENDYAAIYADAKTRCVNSTIATNWRYLAEGIEESAIGVRGLRGAVPA